MWMSSTYWSFGSCYPFKNVMVITDHTTPGDMLLELRGYHKHCLLTCNRFMNVMTITNHTTLGDMFLEIWGSHEHFLFTCYSFMNVMTKLNVQHHMTCFLKSEAITNIADSHAIPSWMSWPQLIIWHWWYASWNMRLSQTLLIHMQSSQTRFDILPSNIRLNECEISGVWRWYKEWYIPHRPKSFAEFCKLANCLCHSVKCMTKVNSISYNVHISQRCHSFNVCHRKQIKLLSMVKSVSKLNTVPIWALTFGSSGLLSR